MSATFGVVAVAAILIPASVTAPNVGFAVSVDTFPFLAGLIDEHSVDAAYYKPFCTGTILTALYVLTTYGCIKTPDRYNRRNHLRAEDLIMIFGTGYSWAPEPASRDELYKKYQSRRAEKYIFPVQSDLQEAFESAENQEAFKSNKFYDLELSGRVLNRYVVDFTVIKLTVPITWEDHTLPGIFPLQGQNLAREWWKARVEEEKGGITFIESCYLIGWGGGGSAQTREQVRLKAVEVRFVPYDQCELSLCALCSYCNRTSRVALRRETCYKSTVYGDACLEDEGGPVWCPWAGVTTTRRGRAGMTGFKTGAILGILSLSPGSNCTDAPGIYANSWQAFPTISRAVGYTFPPNILVYEEILREPISSRIYSHEDYPNVPSNT